MKLSPTRFFSLIKQAFFSMQKDNASVWCAALAYYTVFSLGPLLLIIVSVIGFIFSKTRIESHLLDQLEGLMGDRRTHLLTTVLQGTKHPTGDVVGMIIGTVTLVLGATGVFVQLQRMLNAIWGVKPKPQKGFALFVRQRLLNVSILGAIAFLLLVSLIASTAIAAIGTYLGQLLPFSPVILEVLNFAISLALITLLFAITLKFLPDVVTRWSNIWTGALMTALLFTLGKTLIGIYIGHSGITSTFGVAASLVVLLLWVYYSSQILFFGAEFTKEATLYREKEITPNLYAQLTHKHVLVSPEERTQKRAKAFTSSLIDELSKRERSRKRRNRG